MKSKQYLTALLTLLVAAEGFSQAAPAATPEASTEQLPTIMTWILGIACGVLFIVAMIYIIKVNQFLYNRVVILEAQKSGAVLPDGSSAVSTPAGDDFWTRLRKKYWEDAVPIEKEADIMLQHAHDGIYELDNRLPPWWVNMFILTIIWAVGYMYYYHFGGNGPSQKEEYQQEMETAKKQIAVALAGKANAVDESNVTAVTESGALGEGELIFKNTCAACHGQSGEGGVGPNFTDEYWIHGGGVKNIFKTIKYGVPEKGMISWQSQLKPSDIQKVASYILTLQKTKPANPKAPQGTLWTEAAADTTGNTPAAGK
jgi:cytochrome c oxidase cbb3-type subunit 3